MKKYYVYDIELEFQVRPNDDIYTEYYRHDITLNIDDSETDIRGYIHRYLIEDFEVEFDTPDEPYYETSGADFEYELVDDDSNADEKIKLQKESRYESN